MSINTPSGPDDLEEETKFVDDLLEHIIKPCGTGAGNVRHVYIAEGERAIANGTVKDPNNIARLEDAIRMGKRFQQIEGGQP